jgi:hypothetical protein
MGIVVGFGARQGDARTGGWEEEGLGRGAGRGGDRFRLGLG